jgi:hypothetical protein
LEQDESDDEYIGLYLDFQMLDDPIYGQISYNCGHSNASKLKLGCNVMILLIEISRAMEKEIAQHVVILATVISTCCVIPRLLRLLHIMHRHWTNLKLVEEKRERKMVGK